MDSKKPGSRQLLASAIYRNAARLMEERALYVDCGVNYACHALELAEHGHMTPEDSSYCGPMRDLFSVQEDETCSAAWLQDGTLYGDDALNVRILALCFMAAMVEAGDA